MTVRYDAGVADGSASVPTWIKCKYLAIYFLFNLGLTLYNKAVMMQVCWGYLEPYSSLWSFRSSATTVDSFTHFEPFCAELSAECGEQSWTLTGLAGSTSIAPKLLCSNHLLFLRCSATSRLFLT